VDQFLEQQAARVASVDVSRLRPLERAYVRLLGASLREWAKIFREAKR
jgi:hypothetical protein